MAYVILYNYIINQNNYWKHLVQRCVDQHFYPINTIYLSNIVSMVDHRLRRWATINSPLDQRLVFTGYKHKAGT